MNWNEVSKMMATAVAAYLLLVLQAGVSHGISANLSTLIPDPDGAPFATTSLVLTRNVTLSASLPFIETSVNITLKGACRRYKCVIDGRSKFALFFSDGVDCSITLENLEFRNIEGGVVRGPCAVNVRNCVFRNCSNSGDGGVFQLFAQSAGLWIVGSTFLNNKASGNGGAIAYDVGYSRVYGAVFIVNSSFVANTAAGGGSGGALSLTGNLVDIYLNQVILRHNKAEGEGGAAFVAVYQSLPALPTSPFNVRAIGVRFDSNLAVSGGGGGISAVSYSGSAVFTFCNTTFLGNRAPKANKTYNLRYTSGDPFGSKSSEVRFCGGMPPGTVVAQNSPTPPDFRPIVNTKCLGCSGCISDCNGHGRCTYDGYGQPSCKCSGNRKRATYCADCNFGYAGINCTACLRGFFDYEGRCLLCNGLEGLTVQKYSYLKATAATTSNRCRDLCVSTGVSCTFWAWLAEGSACPRTCVLYSDARKCLKGNVTFDPTYKIYSQEYQQSKCGTSP